MKKKVCQIKSSLLFFLLCLVLSWTVSGHAFEVWNGEVTSNVKMRKSPGFKGQVFGGLKKGDRVLIIDRHKDWYQVTIETDSYAYKGWIFGKYLKKLERVKEALSSKKEKKPDPLVSSKEKISKEQHFPRVIEEKKLKAKEEKGFETTLKETQIALQSETNEEKGAQEPDQSAQSGPPQPSPTEISAKTKAEFKKANHGGDSINFPGIYLFVGLILILSSVILSILAFLSARRASNLAENRNDLVENSNDFLEDRNDVATQSMKSPQQNVAQKRPIPDERRLHRRTNSLVQVDFVVEGRAYLGFSSNISAGGAFIETHESFTIGEKLTLCYPSSDNTGHIKINGEIARTDPKGIAVKFIGDRKPKIPHKSTSQDEGLLKDNHAEAG